MADTENRAGVDIPAFRAAQLRQPWYPYRSFFEADRWSPVTQARADQTIEEWVWEYTSGLPRRSVSAWDDVESIQGLEMHLHAWRFLEPVLQTYERIGVFDYLDFGIQIALNWSRQQPSVALQPPSPWYDSAIGIRALSLSYITDAAARHPNVSNEVVARLVGFSLEHAETLADDNRFRAHSSDGVYAAAGQLVQARRLIGLANMIDAERQARERLRQLTRVERTGEESRPDLSPSPQNIVQQVLSGVLERGLAEETELTNTRGDFVPRVWEHRRQDNEPPAVPPVSPMSTMSTSHPRADSGIARNIPHYQQEREKNTSMTRDSLIQIGRKHKADKLVHGYLPHYEDLLEPLRDDDFEMLEIGVHQGGSIRMWHEYFTAARIVGVDSKPIVLEGELPRYTFLQGSQADWAFMNQLRDEHAFRVIVDDGSHVWGHQIFTFQTLFPKLETGGIYVCEDIQTSYGELAERYHGGAKESAADYFFRVAQAVSAGGHLEFKQTEDPLMHFLLTKIRSVTFIRHGVIIVA